jgi:hypothetical protein
VVAVAGGDRMALRAVLRQTQDIVRYAPGGDGRDWAAAEARLWG